MLPPTETIRTLVSVSLAACLAPVPARAQDAPPPIDPALRARFGFLDPVIRKLGHGTNMLQTVQWADGQPRHVLVNNPHRARLDDLRFADREVVDESIGTDGDLHGLRTADVDGDGTMDVVMVDSRGRLVVELRGKGKPPLPEIEVGRGVMYDCLRCQDLDGDGRTDAVVLTRDGLRTVLGIGANPVVSPATPLFDAATPRSFHLLDVDGDRQHDVVVCAKNQVQLKLGDGRGGFGPWILLSTPKLQTLFPGTGKDGATLAAIHVQPRRVVEYRLKQIRGADRPTLYLDALPATGKPRAFAHGDIDNDGDLDLVLADAERAQLTVFLEEQGRFVTRHAPTLAGVHCLAIGDADGDGKQDLVMTSIEEASLSWISGATGLDRFPAPLATLPEIDGKPAIPVAVAVRDGVTLALLRNSDEKTGLYRITGTGSAKVEELVDLGRVRRDPRRLLEADLDGRNGPDVAYVLPSQGLQVLFRKADGKFSPPSPASSAGFTKRMEDGALSLTGSADQRALLVVRDRYTRTFRFDQEGKPVILSQDNGPDGIPSMALCTGLADGARIFLDRTNKRLYRMAAGRPTVSVELPAISPQDILPHHGDVLLLGSFGVVRVPFGRSYELEVVRSHEPPTPKSLYYDGIAADLDGDGERELAVLDHHRHTLHALVPEGAKLRRGLSFPIFESTNDNDREPRELICGDVNRDGLQDLLLLAHDRILIYYQER